MKHRWTESHLNAWALMVKLPLSPSPTSAVKAGHGPQGCMVILSPNHWVAESGRAALEQAARESGQLRPHSRPATPALKSVVGRQFGHFRKRSFAEAVGQQNFASAGYIGVASGSFLLIVPLGNPATPTQLPAPG